MMLGTIFTLQKVRFHGRKLLIMEKQQRINQKWYVRKIKMTIENIVTGYGKLEKIEKISSIMLIAGRYVFMCPECYNAGRLYQIDIDSYIRSLLSEKDMEIDELKNLLHELGKNTKEQVYKYVDEISELKRRNGEFELQDKIFRRTINDFQIIEKELRQKLFDLKKRNEEFKKELQSPTEYCYTENDLKQKLSEQRKKVCEEIFSYFNENEWLPIQFIIIKQIIEKIRGE